MKRIKELISSIGTRYPGDQFFADFDSSCEISKDKKSLYLLYEKALRSLDTESWGILKAKALRHYRDHREGQLKQGFFNQLNEAFAYRYLALSGASAVRFVPEGTKPTPDLSYVTNGAKMHCEVKTLGISNDEIDRRNGGYAYGGAVYTMLDDGFLNKFSSAVLQARGQIGAFGTNGLVYVIVRPDDIALDHYSTYRKQLVSTCVENAFDDIFIKIGLRGNKRVCITRDFSGFLSRCARRKRAES